MKNKGWFSHLMSYASICRIGISVSVVLSVTSVLAGLFPYFCLYFILRDSIAGTITYQLILHWALAAAAAYTIKTVFFGLSTLLSHLEAYTILEYIRFQVCEKFIRAPLGQTESRTIGEIRNMIVDRIESIEPPLAHLIPEGIGNLMLPLVSFCILLSIDWRMALASLISIALGILPMMHLMKNQEKNYGRYLASHNRVSSVIVEYIEGIQVVKAFGREGESYEKYSKAVTDYRDFVLEWMKDTWVDMKLSFALAPATLLGALPVGLLLYSHQILNPALLALGILLAQSMVGSLSRLEAFGNQVKEMGIVIGQTQEFLDMPLLPENDTVATVTDSTIKISHVSFSYTGKPEDDVLHDISLSLPRGSMTALVGPSGGGKSTIAKLVARFWDVRTGTIAIDNVPVQNMKLEQLSSLVSFVTQSNFLFNCSIRENIRLGKPTATDTEVLAAAQAACCHEFISTLEHGYDTDAGDAGNRLSGGEKQRIAIARMILKNAPVVILDEATAFTDPENEHKIQQSIAALTRNKTLLVIAHRLSTIKNADNIIVLQNGRIEMQGTQKYLLEHCNLYNNMWQAHIGAKDWAAGSSAGGNSNV